MDEITTNVSLKFRFSKNKAEDLCDTVEKFGIAINRYCEYFLDPVTTGPYESILTCGLWVAFSIFLLVASRMGFATEGLASGFVSFTMGLCCFSIFLLPFSLCDRNVRWIDPSSSAEHFCRSYQAGIIGSIINHRKRKGAVVESKGYEQLLETEMGLECIRNIVTLSNYTQVLVEEYGQQNIRFDVAEVDPKEADIFPDGAYDSHSEQIRDTYPIKAAYEVVVSAAQNVNSTVSVKADTASFYLTKPELQMIMREKDVIDFSFVDGILKNYRDVIQNINELENKKECYAKLPALCPNSSFITEKHENNKERQ